ncbi:MAG: DUF1134 domain-containing protein [Pseudomonadota bacterium]|nr:DUF1134 domain-containing protein [Pseudomonadota bacterium]
MSTTTVNRLVRAGSALAAAFVLAIQPLTMGAAAGGRADTSQQTADDTYSYEEIVSAGHHFFGKTTKGLASVVEYAFKRAGEPNGYIVGEEGSGAFVGGLRYGEGTLFLKNGAREKVFWQGPSIGFDFGGNGSRVLALVYGVSHPLDVHERFVGVEGTAYVVGGFGVNFQQYDNMRLAPIRTGVGIRMGLNAGYLKYSAEPTWNPF